MAVQQIDEWRTAGCDQNCYARRHDPDSHERYGYVLALVKPPVRLIRTGPLTVDLARQEAVVNGRAVPMVPTGVGGRRDTRSWRYLECLALRAGVTVDYRTILSEVWDYDATPTTSEHTLVAVVRGRVRAMLGEAGRLIVTVYGIGNRLELEAAAGDAADGGVR